MRIVKQTRYSLSRTLSKQLKGDHLDKTIQAIGDVVNAKWNNRMTQKLYGSLWKELAPAEYGREHFEEIME